MTKKNPQFEKLAGDYLFVEIAKRKNDYLKKHPHAQLISLGIGDTTEAIPENIVLALNDASKALGTREGYTGYESGQGLSGLRERLAEQIYANKVHPDDIFISDGSKCDIGRLQLLFSRDTRIAVQDPSYPAYVASSVISGKTGSFIPDIKQYEGIEYLPCLPENNFFPKLSTVGSCDLIYFCSPNNPTGAVATRKQLKELVDFARKRKAIIIFDSAYSFFTCDSNLPRSIFEIEGAEELAIETGSFSKMVGFTGVRLGWTVVPEALRFDDASSVKTAWKQITSTFFNGASNIVQKGGYAALSETGLNSAKELCKYYQQNATQLKETLESKGYVVYGGKHAPFLWVDMKGEKSWDAFDRLLKQTEIVTTPGLGFGPAGEGFLRFSAFGHHEDIAIAVERLKNQL